MSWFQRLYETYENCEKNKGKYKIAPVAHTHKICNIEITLDEKAKIIDAQIINEDTIVPTTDDNNCMWVFAVDIKTYQKEKDKKGKELKITYKKQLQEWSNFDSDNTKIQIVNKYIQNNMLVQDLIERKLLWVDSNGEFIKKPKNKQDISDKYKIFNFVKEQEDVVIRWIVGTDKNRNTWEDNTIIESWINFRRNKLGKGKCYILGEENIIAANHPYANGSAKLIAAGDDKNFVFNGRFETQEEALNVGFDVSQKAHNVLKWLIVEERKQAYRNYPQIIVVFTINGKSGNVGQVFGKDFVKAIKGYDIKFEQIEENENVVILEMDAASKGRACITYYREMPGSRYLENIQKWHNKYSWEQFLKIKNNDGKEEYKYFIGTPAINTIANAYLYTKNKKALNTIEDKEKKIKNKLIRDLIPSVLEGKEIPEYIEKHFIEKVSNPVALIDKNNDIQWKTILGIACSVYKGNRLYKNKEEDWTMAETRDSLYGQLLALLDYGEERALWIQQKNDSADDDTADDKKNIRITNAKRYMRQFSLKPHSTWLFLLLKYNEAYMPRLKKNNPGLDKKIENNITEIIYKFKKNNIDFENDDKLEGVFVFAYYCQKYELKFNKSLETEIKQKENQNDDIK
jgi:CRISPR-associated protein Csd1